MPYSDGEERTEQSPHAEASGEAEAAEAPVDAAQTSSDDGAMPPS